jgi:DNA (cytosine-5)-methyltransferase 1
MHASSSPPLRTVGLFAGIGGIELGLHQAGFATELLCELDESAQAVLRARFPDIPIVADVRQLDALPEADLVAAGFPCQDLSQAGRTAGIAGARSGLVEEVFRLLGASRVRWLLLENVPFMLQLDKGRAMRVLTDRLADMGFSWAYRVIDAQCFGLPQRRQRVVMLASRTEEPWHVLFAHDAGIPPAVASEAACGFYWTEGSSGLGWAVDAVPTLKGGSSIGIPSPPAIWMRGTSGEIVTPEIRDAERLQGFEADWTLPATAGKTAKIGTRWKLVGNAVSVPMARWIGEQLRNPGCHDGSRDSRLGIGQPWPKAAWGREGNVWAASVSMWPVVRDYQHLAGFLRYPALPLSRRAAAGFLARARKSTLRFGEGFLDAVAAHVQIMQRVE